MPRVLLVEDEKDLAWSICRSLTTAGYEAMAAHTGTEALALARRHPPDLFILDIMLPGIDGLSLCRRFKDDATTAAVPVIFLTAKSAVEHRIEGLSLGPTTISRSRSTSVNCWPASRRCCAGDKHRPRLRPPETWSWARSR